jgi:hypothetical protein
LHGWIVLKLFKKLSTKQGSKLESGRLCLILFYKFVKAWSSSNNWVDIVVLLLDLLLLNDFIRELNKTEYFVQNECNYWISLLLFNCDLFTVYFSLCKVSAFHIGCIRTDSRSYLISLFLCVIPTIRSHASGPTPWNNLPNYSLAVPSDWVRYSPVSMLYMMHPRL